MSAYVDMQALCSRSMLISFSNYVKCPQPRWPSTEVPGHEADSAAPEKERMINSGISLYKLSIRKYPNISLKHSETRIHAWWGHSGSFYGRFPMVSRQTMAWEPQLLINLTSDPTAMGDLEQGWTTGWKTNQFRVNQPLWSEFLRDMRVKYQVHEFAFNSKM